MIASHLVLVASVNNCCEKAVNYFVVHNSNNGFSASYYIIMVGMTRYTITVFAISLIIQETTNPFTKHFFTSTSKNYDSKVLRRFYWFF